MSVQLTERSAANANTFSALALDSHESQSFDKGLSPAELHLAQLRAWLSATHPPRPWRMSNTLRASLGLHVGAVAAAATLPAWWPAIVAAVMCNHLSLVGAGLLPRTSLLGPNFKRLPPAAEQRREVALTFDDGPDPRVTPHVLDVLERYNARASFFVIGTRARLYPELCAEIVKRGHSVENHTERHSHRFSVMGPRAQTREILQAQRTIAGITGKAPLFVRAPAGLRNIFLEPVLAKHGLYLTSWTRRGFDTIARDFRPVLKRLQGELAPGDILLMHDGNPGIGRDGKPLVLEVLQRLLTTCKARDYKMVSLRQGFAS